MIIVKYRKLSEDISFRYIIILLFSVDSRNLDPNKCLRLIFGISKRDHISHTLPTAGLLNISSRRQLHFYCSHKLLLFKYPPYLFKNISFRTDVHNINIRNKGAATIPKHYTEFFKRSFSYNFAKTINSLLFLNLSLNCLKKIIVKQLL